MSKLILADNTSKIFAELSVRHQEELGRLESAIKRLANLSLGEVNELLKNNARNNINSEIEDAFNNLKDIGLTLAEESKLHTGISITDQALRWRINNPGGTQVQYLTYFNCDKKDTTGRQWPTISPKNNFGASEIKARYGYYLSTNPSDQT